MRGGEASVPPTLASITPDYVDARKDAELAAERLWFMEASERQVVDLRQHFEDLLLEVREQMEAKLRICQDSFQVLLASERGQRGSAIAEIRRELEDCRGRLLDVQRHKTNSPANTASSRASTGLIEGCAAFQEQQATHNLKYEASLHELRLDVDVLKERVHLQAHSNEEVRALNKIMMQSTNDFSRAIEDVSSAVAATERKLQDDVEVTRRICASIVDVVQNLRPCASEDVAEAVGTCRILYDDAAAVVAEGAALAAGGACERSEAAVAVQGDAGLIRVLRAAGVASSRREGGADVVDTPMAQVYLMRALEAVQELRQHNMTLRQENEGLLEDILAHDDGTMTPIDAGGLTWTTSVPASGSGTPKGVEKVHVVRGATHAAHAAVGVVGTFLGSPVSPVSIASIHNGKVSNGLGSAAVVAHGVSPISPADALKIAVPRGLPSEPLMAVQPAAMAHAASGAGLGVVVTGPTVVPHPHPAPALALAVMPSVGARLVDVEQIASAAGSVSISQGHARPLGQPTLAPAQATGVQLPA